MSSISRFFVPKRSQCPHQRHAEEKTSGSLARKESDGWEKPVGLMAEWAIEISDDDDNVKAVGDNAKVDATNGTDSWGKKMHKDTSDVTAKDRVPHQHKSSKREEIRNDASANIFQVSPSESGTMHGPSSKKLHSNKHNQSEGSEDKTTNGIGKFITRRVPGEANAKGIGNTTTVDGRNDRNENSTKQTNPFASFAFGLGAESMYFGTDGIIGGCDDKKGCSLESSEADCFPGCKDALEKKLPFEGNDNMINQPKQKEEASKCVASAGKRKQEAKLPHSRKKRKCSTSNFTPIAELSCEDKMKIRKKWQSLADPNAELEVRRFQVLVAARLHARSREPVVRTAMDTLRNHFLSPSLHGQAANGDGSVGKQLHGNARSCEVTGLCSETLSRANPEKIAPIISSVLFANVKARHVIQAAKDIQTRFGGEVPETSHGLQQITGIGPKLADLLSFCNSRASYESAESRK